MKLAGVIVLYNFEVEKVVDNINSYINDIDILIAIDNSDNCNNQNKFISLLKSKKLVYVNNGCNLGIAKALNIGAKKALNLGYKWLLTMDQDSKATKFMVPIMIDFLDSNLGKLKIGIVSPVHLLSNQKKLDLDGTYEEKLTVMTSGNILSLEAYNQVGEFNESFFIDYVDHEYCLRLKKNGLGILSLNKACLIHELGNLQSTVIGFTTNHTALRRYYMTRNRLMVRRIYKYDFPDFCNHDYRSMWLELVRMILLEKDKFKKLKAFFLGIWHFRINRFGKL